MELMTEELFNFTDTSDVPNWAIEVVLAGIKSCDPIDNVRHNSGYYILDRAVIGFARLIARHRPDLMPEDPDRAAVRELWAQEFEEEAFADDVRSGNCDNWPVFAIRLAMFKAGREAERAGK